MRELLVGLILIISFSGLVSGQVQQDSPVSDSVLVQEITVNAFRYGKKLLHTPAPLSIITFKQIQSGAEQPLPELLNKTPGIFMQSGTLNTNRLTIRGVGSRSPYSTNKIRAYFEGIPLTNGGGETSLEDFNLETFSRIEIIKGPASCFYGSGLGGTLLFDARVPNGDVAEGVFTAGSFNTFREKVSVLLDRGEFKHALFYEHLSTDGYRENNQADRSNITYSGRLNSGQYQFNLLVHNTATKAFIPSSIDFPTYQISPKKAAFSWAETKGYENYQKLLGGFSVSSQWKRNRNSQLVIFANQFKNYELRPFNILNEESYYWGGRLILEKTTKSELGEWKFSLGNESFFEKYSWQTFENSERIRGELLSDNDEKRNYLNNFVQINLTAHKLVASVGANVNTTQYRYSDRYLADGDQSGNHWFKTLLSPRLALSYPLDENKQLFAAVSHGFSPPTLEETLMPDGQRNNNIQPETGWNYELGSRGTLFTGLYYDFSFYYMDVRNLLVARRVADDAYLGINAGHTAHPGFEYLVNLELYQSTGFVLKMAHNGNFAPYYFVRFVDGDNDYSGNDLTGSPRFSCFTSLNITVKDKYNFDLNHTFRGKMPLRNDNSVYSKASSVFNFQAAFHKNYKKTELKIMAGIYNLLNEKYASMYLINASQFGQNLPRYYYPGLPRNFSLSVRLNYGL